LLFPDQVLRHNPGHHPFLDSGFEQFGEPPWRHRLAEIVPLTTDAWRMAVDGDFESMHLLTGAICIELLIRMSVHIAAPLGATPRGEAMRRIPA
jgi:hypothetical protein